MNNLKTLQDMEFDISNNKTFLMGVTSEELKAESVKWAKHFYTLQGEGDWSDIELEAIDYFIGHFFNLTSEDLK